MAVKPRQKSLSKVEPLAFLSLAKILDPLLRSCLSLKKVKPKVNEKLKAESLKLLSCSELEILTKKF